jgi:hypothetical protein
VTAGCYDHDYYATMVDYLVLQLICFRHNRLIRKPLLTTHQTGSLHTPWFVCSSDESSRIQIEKKKKAHKSKWMNFQILHLMSNNGLINN